MITRALNPHSNHTSYEVKSSELPHLRVTVESRYEDLLGPVTGYEINWPAYGTVEIEQAEEFGRVMAFACSFARELISEINSPEGVVK